MKNYPLFLFFECIYSEKIFLFLNFPCYSKMFSLIFSSVHVKIMPYNKNDHYNFIILAKNSKGIFILKKEVIYE